MTCNERETGAFRYRGFSAPLRVLHAGRSGYSLLTAADEKIPLSMVHVNRKPQHLVFRYIFGIRLLNTANQPVETVKKALAGADFAARSCPKSSADAGLGTPATFCKIKPSPRRMAVQGAETVQFAPPVRNLNVDNRTVFFRASLRAGGFGRTGRLISVPEDNADLLDWKPVPLPRT